MKIKTLFSIVLFSNLLQFTGLLGQQSEVEYSFNGVIVDSNQQTIENVAIRINYKNKKSIAVNTFDGKFQIKIVDTVNLESISFVHASYEDLTLDAKDVFSFIRDNSQMDYKLILRKKEINLPQVEVTSKLPFYQNENVTVIDYEISPDGNIIILMEKLIFLINSNDSIIATIQNTQGIYEILKACSGRIFFRNKKFIFPTHISKTEILVSKDPIEISSPIRQINELVACDSIIKIKETVGLHSQTLFYRIQLTSDSRSEIVLYVAQNKDMATMAHVDKLEIDNEVVPDRMGELTGGELNIIRNHDKNVWKYEFFTSKKIYSPVFIKHDSILIFDYGAKKMVVFTYIKDNNALKIKTVLTDIMANSKTANSTKVIIQDSFTRELFSVSNSVPVTVSHLSNGLSRKQAVVTLPSQHTFADKIKLHNNVVYYLSRDYNKHSASKTLYRAHFMPFK